MGLTRRGVLSAGSAGVAAAVSGVFLWPRGVRADDVSTEVVNRFYGRTAVQSDRVHLVMPPKFSTGYTVPLDLHVDCPMTEADHVRQVGVFAPLNPLVQVASFHFSPGRIAARVATRIRLAKPQHVVAVAEMSDGTLLMARTWVEVATNGCT